MLNLCILKTQQPSKIKKFIEYKYFNRIHLWNAAFYSTSFKRSFSHMLIHINHWRRSRTDTRRKTINSRHKFWQRMPQPPNGLYDFYSTSKGLKTTLHKDYMVICSLSTTQRPHNYHQRFSHTRTLHGDLTFSRLWATYSAKTGLPCWSRGSLCSSATAANCHL